MEYCAYPFQTPSMNNKKKDSLYKSLCKCIAKQKIHLLYLEN